jgi:formylglycine-generating enzyme required for sulfatase activity
MRDALHRCRLFPLLLTVLLATLAVPATGQDGPKKDKAEKKAEAPKGRKYALVVGVRLYKKDELRPLAFADRDAAALAELFQKGGFRRVVLMTYAAAADDVDVLPTARNVREQLRSLLEDRRPEDTVVVAFVGHGLQPEGDKDFYLCPIDAEVGEKETLLSLADVYKELGKSKARTKLVILDASYPRPAAGATSVRLELKPRPQDVAVPRGTQVLFSAGPGQFSHESKKLERGVFCHYLLEGLGGKAASKSGDVSLDRLVKYVQDEVPDRVKDDAGPRARQVPTLVGEDRAVVLLSGEPIGPITLPGVKGITNSIGMRMVRIPKGRFRMGSPDGEAGDGDERPQHDVEITKDFLMSAHTVTVGQFKAFVKATGYRTEAENGDGGYGYNPATRNFEGRRATYNWKEVGWPQTDRHPVVNVSWNDAQRFCEWLSKKERRTYRLPTEAEWEHACRAGTTTRFWTGDNDDSLKGAANLADKAYRDNVVGAPAAVPWDDKQAFTAPVGSFRPNPWGLFDMHGNVFQWCQDWVDTNYYRSSPVQDPPGPATGNRRVYRGGNYRSVPRHCRSAYRLWGEPVERNCWVGFRVVMVTGPRR